MLPRTVDEGFFPRVNLWEEASTIERLPTSCGLIAVRVLHLFDTSTIKCHTTVENRYKTLSWPTPGILVSRAGTLVESIVRLGVNTSENCAQSGTIGEFLSNRRVPRYILDGRLTSEAHEVCVNTSSI